MSFTINAGRIVADVRVLSVSGRRLIGGFELNVSIEVATPAIEQPTDATVFSEWMGTISCGRSGSGLKQLRTAVPAVPVSLRNHGFADRQQLTLSLELTPEKLAGVEEERAGGDLALKVSLYAAGTHQAVNHLSGGAASPSREQRTVMHEDLNYTVRMTEWIQVLEQMEYQRVMVFSVSLPHRPQSNAFSAAHTMLLRARDQMLQGHFDTVVSLSRSVLESLATVSGAQDAIGAAMEKFRAKGDVRKSMTKRERALVVQEAVRNYTHLAHHVADRTGAPEWYSRADATFVLTLASAAFLEAATRQSIGASHISE